MELILVALAGTGLAGCLGLSLAARPAPRPSRMARPLIRPRSSDVSREAAV